MISGILIFPLFPPSLAWILWLWLGKRGVRTSRVAILVTAIPLTLLTIAAVVLGLLGIPYSPVPESCLIVSLGLAAAAMLLSVVFAISREWEIAKGTGFGSGISLVVWVIAFMVAFALYA